MSILSICFGKFISPLLNIKHNNNLSIECIENNSCNMTTFYCPPIFLNNMYDTHCSFKRSNGNSIVTIGTYSIISFDNIVNCNNNNNKS